MLLHQAIHWLLVSRPFWGGLLPERFPLTAEPTYLVAVSDDADLRAGGWFWCAVCQAHTKPFGLQWGWPGPMGWAEHVQLEDGV